MDSASAICAVFADTGHDVRTLLEKMVACRRMTGLPEDQSLVDDAEFVAVAVSGVEGSDAFYLAPDKRLAVAFMGRITNANAILDSLHAARSGMQNNGSAALVAYLYRRFGIDFLNQLHGYFNIIVWDREKEQLLAFRDHLGFLPFFYTAGTNGICAISSRLRDLIGSGVSPESLDQEAIFHYLCDKSFIAPETPYEHVKSLLPGEYLQCTAGARRTERYYTVPVREVGMDAEEAIDRADSILRTVLAEQIEHSSDIGVLFSGGVDSTLLLSMVKAITEKPVHTYSIVLDSKSRDDEFIHRISNYFGTAHTNITVDSTVFWNHHGEVVKSYPTPGVGGWHVFLGSRAAKKDGIAFVLSGFGGEVDFGIPPYFRRYELLDSFFHNLDPMKTFQKFLLETVRRLAEPFRDLVMPVRLLHQYLELRLGRRKWYDSRITEDRVRHLFEGGGRHFSPVSEHYLRDHAESGTIDFANRLLYSRMKNFEGSKILGKCNELARCYDVELLIPFMDRRMVEFGFSIPRPLKSIGGEYRYIERKLASRYHDFRREKAAFILPSDDWLRSSFLNDPQHDCNPVRCNSRGIFRAGALDALWKAYLSGAREVTWSDILVFFSLDVWLNNNAESCVESLRPM